MDGILGLLESRGVDVRRNTADDNEFKICCPFCADQGYSQDFKYRFGFNVVTGLGHCFNCNYVSRKAILDLVRVFGGSPEDIHTIQHTHYTKKTAERPLHVDFPEGFEYLKDVGTDDEVFGPAKQYVLSRGITERQIEEKDIGATICGFFSYRVVFPVRLSGGKLSGMVGRDWTGKLTPKYLNSSKMKSFYNARPDLYPHKLAIGSEGVAKALAIERATRYRLCSFSFLGHHTTDAKTTQLKGFEEICLFPDPDSPGIKGALSIAANLVSLHKITIAWPWPEKQADELTPKEIRELIKGRRSFSTLLEWEVKKKFKDIL